MPFEDFNSGCLFKQHEHVQINLSVKSLDTLDLNGILQQDPKKMGSISFFLCFWKKLIIKAVFIIIDNIVKHYNLK